MLDLAGKTALVTGAGRGVGRAIAVKFAAAGARVAGVARTASQLAEAASNTKAEGRILAIPADVSDPAEVERVVAKAQEDLGPVDILVNNAGVFLDKPIVETTAEEWRHLFDVNVLGPFLLTRTVLPGMLERDSGRIINMCSTSSHRGYPNQSAYCASKHALLGFTKVLADETHGTNVRVHALSPGGINTALVRGRPDIDLSAYMDPDDVADIALFLAKTDDLAMIDEVIVRRRGSTPFRC